jgi:nucleotide-binding universal stress UspA family protein
MKKIAVLLDFSECSLNALRSAIQIARKTGAEVALTHWYARPYTVDMSVVGGASKSKVNYAEDDKFKREIFSVMDKVLSEIDVHGVKTTKNVVFEKEISEMMKINFFKSVDLIVMGTNGASGLKELFIGSVAQKVVRYALCPVIVAKDFVDYVSLDNIIFVSDFGSDKTIDAFKRVKPILDISEANLHLLKVITPSKFENSQMTELKIDDFVQKTALNNYSKYISTNLTIEKGISDYSNRQAKSLICIATRGLTGFSSFINSLTEDLVNGLDKPLLTIKLGDA